jgi:phosphate transport system substrate-binding protein
MKSLINYATMLMLGAFAIGCGGSDGSDGKAADDGGDNGAKEMVTQKGSDTMVLLAQQWAEMFGRKNGAVTIEVSGGGTGTGISALINGTTDICNASRPMKEEEKAQLKRKNGVDPYEVAVAKDGIAIFVHIDNAIASLTMDQLKGIYEGTITTWEEVGGSGGTIILYGRENSSGTYDFFKEHVLDKGDFAQSTQSLSGTAAVVNAVSKDKAGIGYGGAAYGQGIKVLKVAGDDGTALEPTVENVVSGTYPLSRDLYLYMKEEPFGMIKEYIDWILSDEGQALATELEYFPIRAVGGASAPVGSAAAEGDTTE